MTRSRKILVWVLGSLLALVLVLVIVIATFDWNRLRPTINEQVSQALNRPFAIEGNLAVGWQRASTEAGWRGWIPWPHISAEKLRLGNPDWAKTKQLVTLERVEADIAPLPLLGKTVSIPRIVLSGTQADLERLADGRANWLFEMDEKEEKQPSSWTVDLGTIEFDHAHVRLDDETLKAQVNMEISPLGEPIPFEQILDRKPEQKTEQKTARPQDYAFAWKAQGRYQNQPLEGSGKVGGVLALKDPNLPFPLQVDLRAGATRIRIEGTLTDPTHLGALDLRLRLAGDSLGNLYPLIGVTLPDTPTYATEGRLTANLQDKAGAQYHYRHFSGRIGESDISGDLSFVAGKPRPKLTGELTSNQLLFNDLAPLIGADSNTTQKKRDGAVQQPADKVLPIDPFLTERWRAMDADVRFTGKRIVKSEKLPITDLHTHVVLDDGLLNLEPLRLGMAGGRLDTMMMLDGRQQPLQAKARLNARQLELKRLFPGVTSMQKSLGELNGDAALSGTGNSVAALLGSADGEVKILINDGTISSALMEIAGLNVGNYVVDRLFGDEEVKINCAAADIGIANGLARSRVFVFDTENALVNINGTVNFKTEAMDLDIVPRSKGVRIISLRSPLYVRGTFKEPRPGVQAGSLIARGAGMVILGATLAPVAGLAALIAPSGQQPDQCAPLLKQIQESRPKAG
ncbi:AsmA family protein [Azomonas macrocytogenes]|uniref:AsmA domain-containing protein n=1 Tax=Azomonas macrocytogenes TaxID=69962 RepID=A0A839T2S1_AZOMA|nr:AsmA family protein [Azomonas macrocytogenes]MBB3102003.1 hypothetical protein [Azomonas macrocytogenes]